MLSNTVTRFINFVSLMDYSVISQLEKYGHLAGALEHKDSMGNGEVLRPGEFQRITADTGITHSEFNPSPEEAAHFYQCKILNRLDAPTETKVSSTTRLFVTPIWQSGIRRQTLVPFVKQAMQTLGDLGLAFIYVVRLFHVDRQVI